MPFCILEEVTHNNKSGQHHLSIFVTLPLIALLAEKNASHLGIRSPFFQALNITHDFLHVILKNNVVKKLSVFSPSD